MDRTERGRTATPAELRAHTAKARFESLDPHCSENGTRHLARGAEPPGGEEPVQKEKHEGDQQRAGDPVQKPECRSGRTAEGGPGD